MQSINIPSAKFNSEDNNTVERLNLVDEISDNPIIKRALERVRETIKLEKIHSNHTNHGSHSNYSSSTW